MNSRAWDKGNNFSSSSSRRHWRIDTTRHRMFPLLGKQSTEHNLWIKRVSRPAMERENPQIRGSKDPTPRGTHTWWRDYRNPMLTVFDRNNIGKLLSFGGLTLWASPMATDPVRQCVGTSSAGGLDRWVWTYVWPYKSSTDTEEDKWLERLTGLWCLLSLGNSSGLEHH